MSSTPEDIDALFGAAADPAASAPAPAPAEPVLAGTAPAFLGDSRREPRVKVSWPARLQLPSGRVIAVRMRDLSESGVGLFTDFHIPPNTVVNFAIGVPGLDDRDKHNLTPVSGTLRTAYVVVQGHDMSCGGTWVSLPSDQRELLAKWIRKLRK